MTTEKVILPDMMDLEFELEEGELGLKVLETENQEDGTIIEKIKETKIEDGKKITVYRTLKKSIHIMKVRKGAAERKKVFM
jgi:hypothetical protein